MTEPARDRPRDRLRELLDAVLDDEHRSLGEMAGGAFASPYHFTRTLSREAGEPPVAMRRRVMLERAGWQLRGGASVTDVAFAAGYESVEGFSRAFARAYGHPPSEQRPDTPTWLPAPNGIHFHPPTSLWVTTSERTMTGPLDHLVQHDLDDTRALLELAKGVPDDRYRSPLRPGNVVLTFDGEEASLSRVLERLVFSKEIWLAAILGEEPPADDRDDPAGCSSGRTRPPGGGWRCCATSSGAARGTTGSSTRSAIRPRASCSGRSSPT